MASDLERRKADHLDLCATDAVAFRDRTTMLEQVRFVHRSLPELSLDEIDLSVSLLGKRLRAPLVIAGMTGGHERAAEVNRALAGLAEARGYAFGLGSQRTMQKHPELAWTYRVRDVAPSVLLFGNVGVVQARDTSTADLAALAKDVGADALCVHMNPAMELVQPGGDRDFRGCLDTYRRLVAELPVPVIAKETGNGVGAETAAMLRSVGVRTVDTSGAGGTSWVGVETLRAEGASRSLGEQLWDWGVPTAASVVFCKREGLDVIATGGIRTGYDVARAIALGATAAGVARHAYQAYIDGGVDAANALFDEVEGTLRAVMLLTGARTIEALRTVPRSLAAELREYVG